MVVISNSPTPSPHILISFSVHSSCSGWATSSRKIFRLCGVCFNCCRFWRHSSLYTLLLRQLQAYSYLNLRMLNPRLSNTRTFMQSDHQLYLPPVLFSVIHTFS